MSNYHPLRHDTVIQILLPLAAAYQLHQWILKKRLKDRLEKNAQQFINDTDWDYLVPQLVPKKLVDVAAREYLLSDVITNQKKGNFFYLKALPTKGVRAYSLFRQCLANEKQHSGHESLLRILADV